MLEATCEVQVNGIRVADTGLELIEAIPTALDGLAIAWGRETTADQPDAATCTWKMYDRAGGAGFLDTLTVGGQVRVYSTVQVPSTGGHADNVATDPGYSNLAVGSDPIGVRATTWSWPAIVVDDGAPHGIAISSQGHGIFLTPGVCSTVTGAWDSIPKLTIGASWHWSIDVWAPLHVQVTAAMVGLISPRPDSQTSGATIGPVVTVAGTGGWQTISATVVGNVSSVWPGVWVDLEPEPTWDQQPEGQTWDQTPDTWNDYGFPIRVDNIVLQPPAVTSRRVLVYSGRITDLVATPTDDGLGVEVAATAVDFTADLANVFVGDQPWLAQSMSARFARILALVGTGAPIGVVAPTIGGYQVSWRDVDSQSAADLLRDLATTVDGVMWAATHITTGPRIWVEDPQMRAAVATIGLVGGLWTIVVSGSASGTLVAITSCDLLSEPVQWTQDTSEVITRVDATYLAQTLDDDGLPAPTEAHVLQVDSATEALLGVRRLGWTSQLTQAADASAIAEDILTRSRAVDWRISGLTWDTQLPLVPGTDEGNAVANLLDGTLRLGLPMIVTDLPSWAPSGEQVGVYVEGGTWTFEAGRWILAMTVTPGAGQSRPMTWNQAPAGWTWNTTDPAVDWRDLAAVGPAAAAVATRRPPSI